MNGELQVVADQWPIFLYANYMYDLMIYGIVKSGPPGTSPAEVRRVERDKFGGWTAGPMEVEQRGDLRGHQCRMYVSRPCQSRVLGDRRT